MFPGSEPGRCIVTLRHGARGVEPGRRDRASTMDPGEKFLERVDIPTRAPYYSQACAAVKLAQDDCKQSCADLVERAARQLPGGHEEKFLRRVMQQILDMVPEET